MLRNGVVAIFLLLAVIHGCVARNANSGEFPGHVAIYMPVNRFGEGVILNRNHVLTVAENCFDLVGNRLAPGVITVRAGAINLGINPPPFLNVLRVYAHEGYNRYTMENNIAVLRMQLDFLFQPENVLPFIGPALLHDRIVPENTANCEIVGWNAPPNNVNTVLQVINQIVMDRVTCNSILPNPDIRGRVLNQHMCVGIAAANTAICNNNRGGGFYCNRRLVGLIVAGRQCSVANSPAIMIQTRWHARWIEQQFLREDNPSPGPVAPPTMTV